MTEPSIWLKLRLLKDMAAFQTLQTWIGHNATRYHNLNVLPHALPYIFSEIFLVWGYLQRVTTRYHQFFLKNLNIYLFINFKVTCGNLPLIAQTHSKPRKNV